MRESELESILVREVRRIGGRAYKWVSPGNDGVPDRIVFFPDGRVFFVELKTETGKLSAVQKIQINRLKELKQTAITIKGLQELIIFFSVCGYKETAERLESMRKEVRPDEVHTS